MTMTLVSTVEVGSGGTASIEFTNIPQTGKDLWLLVSGNSNSPQSLLMTLNSNTSVSRYAQAIEGSGSLTAQYFLDASTNRGVFIGEINGSGYTANTFSTHSVYLANYTDSSAKFFSGESTQETNGTTAYSYIIAGKYALTSGVTTLKLDTQSSGNFAQYTTASLYIIS